MMNILEIITKKKNELDNFRPLPPELISNLDEWFKVELTYTSNAIEGNTLSRVETAMIVEKGITVEGKTLNEHQEAINHAQAFDFIKSFATKKKQDITESDILDIHRIILTKIDDDNAGRYRRVPVRIAGSMVIMPNAVKVLYLMKELIEWLHSDSNDHPIIIAAQAHYKLVTIHPFVDGNGRTARLLMNLILLQMGYPPAIIRKEDRRRYINSIEKAQLGGSLDDFLNHILESVEFSLDIYLKSAKDLNLDDKTEEKSESKLLKIGELAKLTGEAIHTLRFWTKEGLLPVKNYTNSGYQLYEPLLAEKVREIRRLQQVERRTVREIREMM